MNDKDERINTIADVLAERINLEIENAYHELLDEANYYNFTFDMKEFDELVSKALSTFK